MSTEHLDAHGGIDPLLTRHADETGPIEIPDDFVPTETGWTLSQKVGVVTGGVLFALTVALFSYGLTLGGAW